MTDHTPLAPTRTATPGPLPQSPDAPKGPGEANAQMWLFLLTMVMIGGSSFAGIRLAVETAPPSIVGAGRLWVATFFLFVYMQTTGRRMIPLRNQGRLHPAWLFAIGIGLTGYSVPMVLFPFAQQSISSLLAGIYMAFMPIVTVFLAAIFADEPLTKRKLIGFVGGTIGVILLIGPGALQNIFSESVIAQLALLVATTGYAIASVIMRRAPVVPARSFAVAFMLVASLLVTPLAISDLMKGPEISLTSWLAIITLGLGPTGATAILIITMVRNVGAGFVAMSNYLTPMMAILVGVLAFGEQLEWRYLAGLLVILTGLAIAQPGPLRLLRQRLLKR